MVEALARWLGTYAIQVLSVLLVAVLLLIALLWRLFEAYYGQLWSWGNTLWQRLTRLAWAQRLERRYPRLWAFLGRRLSPGGYLAFI